MLRPAPFRNKTGAYDVHNWECKGFHISASVADGIYTEYCDMCDYSFNHWRSDYYEVPTSIILGNKRKYVAYDPEKLFGRDRSEGSETSGGSKAKEFKIPPGLAKFDPSFDI